MKTKLANSTIKLALAGLVVVFAACNPGTTVDLVLDPQNAYGEAGAPLPAGAVVVSQEEFKQRLNKGKFRILKHSQLQQESTNQRNRKNAHQSDIQALLAQHPKLKRLFTPPSGPNVVPTGDGNYLLTVGTASGPKQVVTMGPETMLSDIIEGRKKFFSRRNQLRLYSKVYAALSPEAQKSFTSPNALDQVSTEQLVQQNQKMTANLAQQPIVGTSPAQLLPPGYVSDPNQEQGKGKGLDRSSCTQTHNPQGIYANFGWPLKYYVTSVKDQGGRGTCTAFAVTGAVEAHVALTYGRWVNLSEQMLYNYHKRDWYPTGDSYGDGAVPAEMLEQMDIENYGQPLERVWNYNPSEVRTENDTSRTYTRSCDSYDESCSDTNHQSEVVCTPLGGGVNYCINLIPTVSGSVYEALDADVLWSDESGAAFGLTLLQQNLANKNPVVLSIEVVPSFDDADDQGFVSYDPNEDNQSRGGHAVLATGFITNSELAAELPNAPLGSGGGYVIIKNSWGGCWGDAGYAYLPFSWVMDYAYRGVALDSIR